VVKAVEVSEHAVRDGVQALRVLVKCRWAWRARTARGEAEPERSRRHFSLRFC